MPAARPYTPQALLPYLDCCPSVLSRTPILADIMRPSFSSRTPFWLQSLRHTFSKPTTAKQRSDHYDRRSLANTGLSVGCIVAGVTLQELEWLQDWVHAANVQKTEPYVDPSKLHKESYERTRAHEHCSKPSLDGLSLRRHSSWLRWGICVRGQERASTLPTNTTIQVVPAPAYSTTCRSHGTVGCIQQPPDAPRHLSRETMASQARPYSQI